MDQPVQKDRTRELAEFVVGLRLSDLSDKDTEHLKGLVLDHLGVAFRGASLPWGEALADWAESRLLWPVALYASGINAERFPTEFHRDRAALHGKPVPDVARVKASAAKYLGQMRSELAAIEDLFVDGAPYVLGDTLGLADLAVYHVPWFLDALQPGHAFLDNMPLTREWMTRVAALGHGQVAALEAGAAIERANQSSPRTIEAAEFVSPEGLRPGDSVSVSPGTMVTMAR